MSVTRVSVRTSTPEAAQLLLGLVARALRIGGQQPRAALEQHHGGLAGIDVAEVAAQRVAPDLGHGAGHLDAGRAAAHDDEGEVGVPADRVGLPLGALERQQHPAADLERVLQALEPGRERLPLVVAEVGVPGAGGDDQVVVGDASAPSVKRTLRARRRRCRSTSASSTSVFFERAEDRADGRGDVARIEPGGGHLVEHRLEQVVVAAVHQRHPHRARRAAPWPRTARRTHRPG